MRFPIELQKNTALRFSPLRVVVIGAAVAAILLSMSGLLHAYAQQAPWSQRVAENTIKRWPDGRFVSPEAPWRWNYELGTLLEGMDATWYNTANREYYQYVKRSVDQFVSADGSIKTYEPEAYSLDNLLLGRQLLLLYRATQDKRYYKAASLLRQQLSTQPKTASGGFWHKQIYPGQMWLDGLYMAEPFYAEYASVFQEPQDFAEITRQFVLIEQHRTAMPGRDCFTTDGTRQRSKPWANQDTGDSSSFWARGMGWYMMALVDSLQYYPESDPGRVTLLAILNRTASAIAHYQDAETGLWYQVLDKPERRETTSSLQLPAYLLMLSQRECVWVTLPRTYSAVNAKRSWEGIQKRFLEADSSGTVTLTGTVQAIGLGGAHHRDGSYDYYISSPVMSNDPKEHLARSCLQPVRWNSDLPASSGLRKKVASWTPGSTARHWKKRGRRDRVTLHYKWSDYSNPAVSAFGAPCCTQLRLGHGHGSGRTHAQEVKRRAVLP